MSAALPPANMDEDNAEEEDLDGNSGCGGIWSMFMAFRSKVLSADYNEVAVAESLGKDKLSTSTNEWPIFGSQIGLKYADGKNVLRFMNIPGLTKKDVSDHLRYDVLLISNNALFFNGETTSYHKQYMSSLKKLAIKNSQPFNLESLMNFQLPQQDEEFNYYGNSSKDESSVVKVEQRRKGKAFIVVTRKRAAVTVQTPLRSAIEQMLQIFSPMLFLKSQETIM